MGESGDILNAQLCDAVRKDDIEGANHLLEKGASVDARKKSFLVSVDWECVSGYWDEMDVICCQNRIPQFWW